MKIMFSARYRIATIVLFALTWLNSYAIQVKESNHQVKVFSNREGFSQNTVVEICSDQTGDLWFGTVNGLIRYDGYEFFNYSTSEASNSIQSNLIKTLFADKKGRVWIANSGGLCVYDPISEDFSRIVNDTKPTAFSQSPDSCIWVSTDKYIEIYQLDQIFQVKRKIPLDDYLINNILSIKTISNTQCIIATFRQILMVDLTSKNDFQVTVLEPLDFELSHISALITEDNFLWIGTDNSLMQCAIDQTKLIIVRNFPIQDILGIRKNVQVKSIFIDREDKIWIGTRNEGILEFDRPSNTFYTYLHTNNKGLSSPYIRCFFEDEFKSIWIGTAQGGVNQIDKTEKSFFSYTTEPYNKKSLSGHLVNFILEDNKGYIWTSFSNYTISKSSAPITTLNNLEFKRVQDKNNTLKNNEVMYMFQDSRGWMWFCDYYSTYLYDEKNHVFHALTMNYNGQPADVSRTRKIIQLDNGTFLLIGNGLAIIKDPLPSIFTGKPVEVVDMHNFGVEEWAEGAVDDNKGTYWVATYNGLKSFKVDNGKIIINNLFEHCKEDVKSFLSNTRMLTVHYSDTALWIGTFGKGLVNVHFDSKGEISHLTHFNKSDGLSDDMVYGILDDGENNLWISTDMGICKLNTNSKTIDVFDINDGMLHNNFRRYAYLKTKSNAFIFGGLNGLTVFNPRDIEEKQIPPKVKISQIRVDNKNISPGYLAKYNSQTSKLTLSPRNKSLHIEVLTQHSATPHKNKVAYLLDGVDDNWVNIDEGKTMVNYTGLRPGSYTFRYKGTNGDGVETEQASALQIKVLAPWYSRWYSLLLFVFLIFLFANGLYQYRIRLTTLKQNLKFEQLDKERIHEMDQAKLRLFTNISHEFKTPLSLIMAPIEKMMESNKNEANRHYISIIQSNIKRLQRLIEQLVAYRQHDQGKLKIHYSKISLGDFVFPLIEAFEDNIASKNIAFIHSIEEPNKEVVIDPEKAELIVFNILSNAVKYTKSGGQIEFKTFFDKRNNGMLTFAVTDNGIGILPENITKIFDRYYRSERSGSQSGGSGIGLAFSKSLADAMNGSIEVSSEPNNSTTFIVSLPYQNTPEKAIKKSSAEYFPKQVKSSVHNPEKIDIDSSSPTLLIIDDEIDFRHFLQHAFGENYNVVLAESGEEALRKLQIIPPDLIICDVMMEGLSGFEVCEKIKLDPYTCHIPVILLTALSAEQHESKSVELGADYYMQKPFSIHLLEAKVKQLIDARKLLQEYFSKTSHLPDETMGIPLRERKFLEKINDAIEENMSNSEFSLSDMASVVGYSVSHFSRKLKQITGQVPNLYIRNYRLQKAAEMLSSDNGINTKEVMYEVGISSPSYFSTAFKKVYGVAPSVYRDTIQGKDKNSDVAV